jgi:hypothetical protein
LTDLNVQTHHGPPFRRGQNFPLHIRETVAFDLSVYCDALGAQWTETINRSVREFIDRELNQNEGFRTRFERLKSERLEEERRQRHAPGHDRFRLIDSRTRTIQKPGSAVARRPKRRT